MWSNTFIFYYYLKKKNAFTYNLEMWLNDFCCLKILLQYAFCANGWLSTMQFSFSFYTINAIKDLGDNKKIAKNYFRLLLVTVKCYKAYLSLFRVPTVAGNLEYKENFEIGISKAGKFEEIKIFKSCNVSFSGSAQLHIICQLSYKLLLVSAISIFILF